VGPAEARVDPVNPIARGAPGAAVLVKENAP